MVAELLQQAQSHRRADGARAVHDGEHTQQPQGVRGARHQGAGMRVVLPGEHECRAQEEEPAR